ncbi:MAG: hypothetical protein NVSMB47_00570 [Polyangiales bacterium]
MDPGPPRRTWSALVALTLVAAAALIALARRQWWSTDDALITFRYVDNLVHGRGLVYDLGERIESFSSPLFVVLLAPLRAFGASPFIAANLLGILASLIELAMLVALVARRSRSLVPAALAAALFATDRIVAVWATSGLETATVGALVFAAFAVSTSPLGATRVRGATVLHVALAFARPEGVAFYPIYLVLLWRRSPREERVARVIRSLNVMLPALAVLLCARWLYYRALLPNPFRAKVAGVPEVGSFGRGYVEFFARRIGWLDGAHGLAWIALAIVALWGWNELGARKEDSAGASAPSPLVDTLLAGLAYVALQLAIVAGTGGDYMCDFRFVRPVIGVLYAVVGLAFALGWSIPRSAPRVAAAAVAAALLFSHGLRQVKASPVFEDVTAGPEHKASLTVTDEDARRFREALLRFADPTDVLIVDKAGVMGFGHTLRTVDATGLLSERIEEDFYVRPAWSDLGPRERFPGHARWPRVDFMQRVGATFIFPKLSPRPPSEPEVGPWSPQRHRDYPFLHVVVPMGDGRYLRFFTTLDAPALAARATRRALPVCWRPPFGALTCTP